MLNDKRLSVINEQGYGYLADTTEQAMEEKLITAETYRLVLAAIETMPTGYQRVFRGVYLEGKSYEQLADELDTNTTNIRNQKFKAILFLRKKLPPTSFILVMVGVWGN